MTSDFIIKLKADARNLKCSSRNSNLCLHEKKANEDEELLFIFVIRLYDLLMLERCVKSNLFDRNRFD